MKIYFTHKYRITYQHTGGSDIFTGRYILATKGEWLQKMLTNGTAQAERVK